MQGFDGLGRKEERDVLVWERFTERFTSIFTDGVGCKRVCGWREKRDSELGDGFN